MARIYALVLGDITPKRKAEFLKRADEPALSRLIGGVQHPSDLVEGKIFADLYYAALRKNSKYLRDLETVRPIVNP